MGRPYPHQRRRRPGRRPPYRYRAPQPPPNTEQWPLGYSAPGLRQLYDFVLPFRGPGKRAFFNATAGATTLVIGVAAGAVGYGVGGPLGGLLGFGLGRSAGGRYLEWNRFHRA